MYKSVDRNDVTYRQSKKRGCCYRNAVTILFCCGLILLITGVICEITNVIEDWVKDEIRDVSVKLSPSQLSNKFRSTICIHYSQYK